MLVSLRDVLIASLVALSVTVTVFLGMGVGDAQVMQSTNYKIQSDSVNFGGGFSSSTNYSLESTAGEVATGDSSSTNFNLRAGYQQMLTSSISMTAPSNVTMSPSIPGVTGGVANGSTTVVVTTDSPAGYELSISASESPALRKGGDSIGDYTPSGADPDFTFRTGVSEAHFGYSPSGPDTATRFLDDGLGVCNTDGGLETSLTCWDGLSLISEAIARSSGGNSPTGATTTVYFRVWIGGLINQTEGTYTATTTLTALSL